MSIGNAWREARRIRTDSQKILAQNSIRPSIFSRTNFRVTGSELRYAFELVAEEKEIVFFAALQWVVVILAYLAWTQLLDWIPDSLWEQVRDSSKKDNDAPFFLMNLVLLAWSFLIVAVASYPIGLLNAAIASVHYLRIQGETSTIAKALSMSRRNLGQIWTVTTVDAWITVNAILDRLLRKRNNRKASDELLYYAWKIGSAAIVPALVGGKGLLAATADSVKLLLRRPAQLVAVRMSYSLLCWIVGIAGYIFAFYYLRDTAHSIGSPNLVFRFWFQAALPIALGAGLTAVLLRPFYLITVTKLYTDEFRSELGALPPPPAWQFDWLVFVFSCLLVLVLTAYFFGDALGLRAAIEAMANRDIESYRQFLNGQ